METDYLIIGQGICGTFLSWYLQQLGQSFLVMDHQKPFSPSRVASGVVNPVTGRILATTWLAETLIPFTGQAYEAIGASIQADVIKEYSILSFPSTHQMKEAHEKRIAEFNSYIEPAADHYPQFRYLFGSYSISPVWLVDLHPLLNAWRDKLMAGGQLLEENFDLNELRMDQAGVRYKNIRARKIIFCNGTESFRYPFWKNLPYADNKGEALIVDMPSLSRNHIYKLGSLILVPWYEGQWWVGSSYDRVFESAAPTQQFRDTTQQQLEGFLDIPFTVKDHLAAVRPANMERRPFVGLHPHFPSIGILNGMGTKGCSLAPYFASQLADHLVTGKAIDAEADVQRFRKTLAREF